MRFYLLLCLLLAASFRGLAQPSLPEIIGSTQRSVNILSWTSQYNGIKSIAVQRSADSFYNYATIGYVKDLRKGAQGFIDGHPIPGKNWYRLYIVFNSDLTWYSNRLKLYVDSAQLKLAPVMAPNDSLQRLVSRVKLNDTGSSNTGDKPLLTLNIPEPDVTAAFTYIRSQYVFTNPFTGHVNVELPDITKTPYSLRFFNSKDQPIIYLQKLTQPVLVIDKRNFQRKGLFRFELMRGLEKIETGYITIY